MIDEEGPGSDHHIAGPQVRQVGLRDRAAMPNRAEELGIEPPERAKLSASSRSVLRSLA
jgi:hypothetical protein